MNNNSTTQHIKRKKKIGNTEAEGYFCCLCVFVCVCKRV